MYYVIGRTTNTVIEMFETLKEAEDWLNQDDRYLFWYIEQR